MLPCATQIRRKKKNSKININSIYTIFNVGHGSFALPHCHSHGVSVALAISTFPKDEATPTNPPSDTSSEHPGSEALPPFARATRTNLSYRTRQPTTFTTTRIPPPEIPLHKPNLKPPQLAPLNVRADPNLAIRTRLRISCISDHIPELDPTRFRRLLGASGRRKWSRYWRARWSTRSSTG